MIVAKTVKHFRKYCSFKALEFGEFFVAHKAVGARIQGDVYQGLFFWHQAALLLKPNSKVYQVDIEHDAAAGVDDVAVFYDLPGKAEGPLSCTAEFFQLKHHVDQRDTYCSEMMIDPLFLGSSSTSSLLQRFHNAYHKMRPHHSCFLLNLVSNWQWKSDDVLAKSICSSGALPDSFFSKGKKSALGKVRESWRQHLRLSENDFKTFAETLRFELNFFSQRKFQSWVFDRFDAVGLQTPDLTKRVNPYDSLVQQFLVSGPNSFNPTSLKELCEKEELFAPKTSEQPRSLALRSFMRFAENIEAEADEFVCVTKEFDGRHPRRPESWVAVRQEIGAFLSDPERRQRLRTHDYSLLLECHGSAALIAGYELSLSSGCNVYPLQKPGRVLWKPSEKISRGDTWCSTIVDRSPDTEDIAVLLSVTRDISPEVLSYLKASGAPAVRSLVNLMPTAGAGFSSVKDPNHAYALAADFVTLMGSLRPSPRARIHLFTSAPNALLFFLGQFRESLRRMVLYEYDFGAEKHGTYEPSIHLPLTQYSVLTP